MSEWLGEWVAGVDEAGRGPLAGSVVAAAVILPDPCPIVGLADSKTLSEKKRDQLASEIKYHAVAWCIASASVAEIDQLNILQASLLAMRRAVEGLTLQPQRVLVDGNRIPSGLAMAAEAIVKGDSKVKAISAASILAKTARDAELLLLDEAYPQYGFAAHKGYPTAAHLAALEQFGPIAAVHRLSFAPVKRAAAQQQRALF